MPDAITLCSGALTMLGAKPITSFDDPTDTAAVCKLHYPLVTADLLGDHDWNFASKRAANLAQLATAPTWDYSFAFQLPADCLFVRATSEDDATGGTGGRWKVEGLTLVADVSQVSIRYTAQVPEGAWTADFGTAVMFALAARIAYSVTGKPSMADALSKAALVKLQQAKTSDGQEGSPEFYTTTALTSVRM